MTVGHQQGTGQAHVGTTTRTRRARCIAAIAVLALAAAACGGDDGGGQTPSGSDLSDGPTFKQGDPCTIVSDEQVAEVFGGPVTVDPTNGGSPLTTDCAYTAGDPAAPAGRLVVNVVYPALGVGEGADALSVVESDRATAQIAGPGVFDLPVGQAGFLESSRSLAEFVLRPELAVSLQWYPTGGPPEGSPATDEVQDDLTRLAKDIVERLSS